jgi:outer membrane lipoprotein SlyB
VLGLLFAAPMILGGCREEACEQCGTIESITPRVVQGDTSGGGAVAGAIVGGVVGHQFGSGRGNDAATVAGAVGGAVAGNEIERSRKRATVYDVAIRMQKGELRHFTVNSSENLRPGDRVRVEGDRVLPDAGPSA